MTDFVDIGPRLAPWDLRWGVGGALFTTFALGFTEGCLEVERRPIPLRFALRFAAANVLPSAVWASVPARHVAAASGASLSALINETEATGSRSVVIGKRLVLIKSVRALRMAAGSYGLAWSLWRWQQASTNDKQEVAAYGESVVRLAPVNSPLSRASRRKHGEHVVTVPVSTENWKKNRAVDAVNWGAIGIQLEDEAEYRRVKVIEVELSDPEKTTAYAGKLKTQASKGDGASVCSVAVLPMSGSPLPASIVNSFDVYFNPLSAVLKFIASVCHERGVLHVVLVADEEDESVEADVNSNGPRRNLSTSQLVTGLLYRHGITSSVLKAQEKELVDEQLDGASTANNLTGNDYGTVFFTSESLSAGQAAARQMNNQGLVSKQNVYFIVEESLGGQSLPSEVVQAESELLEMATSSGMEEHVITEQQETLEADDQKPMATVFSVADVTDQTLQSIRKLVRLAKKPNVIQAAVYQAYGTQRVVVPARLDQFSDMHV
ncbi:hypothetical protein V7S43_009555 [Phytophthora oleae]|uniref:Uncharacterized protein n=1 Tax=Phytophthora oleae TaxID=2107226 RepID=A0ABD3FF13_9STRA